MNKTQLVEAIALDANISKIEARKAVDALIRVTVQALREEERITLTGLGTFSVQHKAARTGRNPRTGNGQDSAAQERQIPPLGRDRMTGRTHAGDKGRRTKTAAEKRMVPDGIRFSSGQETGTGHIGQCSTVYSNFQDFSTKKFGPRG